MTFSLHQGGVVMSSRVTHAQLSTISTTSYMYHINYVYQHHRGGGALHQHHRGGEALHEHHRGGEA